MPASSLVSMIALVLAVIWLLGSISSHTIGGYIHVCLLVAIGLMLPRLMMGRKLTS